MSLREKLQETREQSEAKKEAASLQEAETQKVHDERIKAEKVEGLRTQIADLKTKKVELETALSTLKEGYRNAETALGGSKKEGENIAGIYDEFKDDLAAQGISNKVELIKSPDYVEDEEMKKYKEAGTTLREKVGSLRIAKEALKAEMPDLNFRGGHVETEEEKVREAERGEIQSRDTELKEKFREGYEKFGTTWRTTPEYEALIQENFAFVLGLETKGFMRKQESAEIVEKSPEPKKTPREQSIEKAEKHIMEIGKQIEALEEQTPERIEEKKKIAECLNLLQRERRLPGFADTIRALENRTLVPENDTVDYYSRQFTEGALKRALFEGLSPKIDKIVENEIRAYEEKYGKGSFDEGGMRSRVENMLRTKIDADIVKEKARNFERNNNASGIEAEASSIWEKKRAAEREMPEIVRAQLKYKDRLDEEVRVNKGNATSGRFLGSPFGVESLATESLELRELKKQLEGYQLDYTEDQDAYKAKLKNPPMLFGKEKHQQELAGLQERAIQLGKKVTEIQNAIKEQERKDAISPKNIDDLGRLIMESKLTNELGSRQMSIRQLLEETETLLKQNQSKTLTPEQEEVIKQYNEMRTQIDVAEREYARAKNNY